MGHTWTEEAQDDGRFLIRQDDIFNDNDMEMDTYTGVLFKKFHA